MTTATSADPALAAALQSLAASRRADGSIGATEWDLVVIGGGAAGLVAATTAAGFGVSALLVERDRTGGDCLWTGCVPSKTLLAAASAASGARKAAAFGVHVDGVRVDFAAVMAHVHATIAAIEPDDSPETLTRAGVTVVRGIARFTGPSALDVDGQQVRFRQAVIATGSEPLLPPITGLAEVDPLTSDTVWSLTELPERLVVLGGGSIGCELGQAFVRLGSHVTVIEAAPRLLMREDEDAAAEIEGALRRDGADVLTGAAVTAVHTSGDGADGDATGCGITDKGAGEVKLADGRRIGFGRLLVSVGRAPRNSHLGLDAAGVEVNERGYVTVNRNLRTTNRRIWAAGDITGHPQFTHVAGVHGSLAASNAILGLRRRVELASIPRVTYTHPELAAVGLSQADADRYGLTARTVPHETVDRAVIDGRTGGFTRLVLDKKGRVLGASVVGPRAGEVLAELTLAVRCGLRASDLAATMHAYPTYSQGAWDAAVADVRARLNGPGTARALTMLSAARRRWMDLRSQ